MRCSHVVTVLMGILLGQIAIGGRAQAAADPVPSAAPSAAPPAPAAVPASPDPWLMPPGTVDPGPGGYAGQAPAVVPDLQLAIASYHSGRRSRAFALVIEWFIPGGGSLYGDHFRGAAMTWGLMLAGVVLVVYGLTGGGGYDAQTGMSEPDETRLRFGLVGGLGLLVVGRGYGFVNAWQSTGRYNEGLRLRLGVPVQYARDRHVPAGQRRLAAGRMFGPQLAFRF